MENVNLPFTLPNLQETLFFSLVIVDKPHITLCLHVTVFGYKKFSISAVDETSVKSKQELPLGIFQQYFVYSIFYCPYSGEEESSSSSSSSSSLNEHGVSPRDSE